MLNKLSFALVLFAVTSCTAPVTDKLPGEFSIRLSLKSTGNPSEMYILSAGELGKPGSLVADSPLPLDISYLLEKKDQSSILKLTLTAKEECNFNIAGSYNPTGISGTSSEFLLPGFWYHKNARSPENAPNIGKGSSWIVREDRLSSPLAAVYDSISKSASLVMRNDIPRKDALMPLDYGEMILYSPTDIGGIGFGENPENASLLFTYPFTEKPFTYRRKLWLAPATTCFMHIKAGETKEISWKIYSFEAASFSDFVEKTWSFAYKSLDPQPVPGKLTTDSIKAELSQYFRESYIECGGIKGSSGVGLKIDECEVKGEFEVGFVGRILLNAFNTLEYGYEKNDTELINIGNSIIESYSENGFTGSGIIREYIDCEKGYEADIFSLRRQSEGLMAFIHFLHYEKKNGGTHPGIEAQCLRLLDRLVKLQREDGSFPRKFNNSFEVVDKSGGSTPSIIPTLVVASAYFKQPSLLAIAQNTANFLDKEIVDKADYFSSTLDANCEDKEASLYTLNSYYYLWLASNENLKKHYLAQARKVSFFALSWYYMWDVPFAPGQMLGDLGFKTRGWGNVSVENNHVDVYVFEFTEVLKWLSEQTSDTRYAAMASLISSSMKDQLLPRKGYLCGIAKAGYHPEVVQHTHWDYGKNGKGYYNDIFAPGWVVSSLWELLTPGRTSKLIITNTEDSH